MTRDSRPAALQWVRPPQQTRSQETLDRILDAAEALAAEKGFAHAPVSEIVRRAGSSVGAFYTRFADKQALLQALYQRFFEQATATADDALDPGRWQGARIPELIAEVVRFLVAIYRERGGLMRAFVARQHTDAGLLARRERLSHYVSDKLAALLLARRDEIAHPDPERASAFGLTFVFSTLDDVMLFGEMRSGRLALSDADLATELTRAYLAYLGTRAT
jgi:AcrR family transcriptional regulator